MKPETILEPTPATREPEAASPASSTAMAIGDTPADRLSRCHMNRFAFSMDRKALPLLLFTLIVAILLILSMTVLLIGARDVFFNPAPLKNNETIPGGVAAEEGKRPFADGVSGNAMLPWADEVKIIPAANINAAHAALADLSTGEVIASRKADETIYPASMTKVMTLIVVVENLPREDCLQDTVTVSQEVYDQMKAAGSSGIGLAAGEKLSVESLLYALMLQSDGIAACELARYVAGSVEDFVELMNQKAEKMGLSTTHFVNPTGLYHPEHVSTAREVASIMAYAMRMQLCRRVMMTQSYEVPCTGVDGQQFHYFLKHNLIVQRFETITPNQPGTVQVVAAKTGYTPESGVCLVTYAESKDGHGYVCVTAKSESYEACIKDYLTVYNTYAKP